MEARRSSRTHLNRTRFPIPPLTAVVLIVLLLSLWIAGVLSSTFTIQPHEVGVVLRFGEINRTVEPGLNFKLPAPVEQVWKVPVPPEFKREFGFRTDKAGETIHEPEGDLEGESLMIAGDLNIVAVEWIVHYRISDLVKYLTRVSDIIGTFRDLSEAEMRAAVGDRSIDEVFTVGRLEIEDEVKLKLQEFCDRHETGIVVDQIVIQDVNVPEPVKPSFDDINEAVHECERALRDARASSGRTQIGGSS